MIILTTTNLSFVLTGASVSPLTVVGSYVDLSDSTYSPNPFTAVSNGTTPVTVLSAPDVNYARQIKFLSINNPNALVASVILSHGTTQLIHIDLATGCTLLYADGRGFSVMDPTGMTLTAVGTSTLGGGSGIASYTVGDLLYASSLTGLAKLSDVAVGSILASGGVGVAPAWSPSLALTGKVTTYNNIVTSGWGVPAIQSSGRVTAQTAANASIATYTVGAADGSFEVSANLLATTSTSYSINITVAFTDESNTVRTVPLNMMLTGGNLTNSAPLTAVNGPIFMGTPMHIRCKAATTITIATSGAFTTITYNAEGSIRQIA